MKKLLLLFFVPLLIQSMQEKPKIKDIFIDNKLENDVRLFTKKSDEKLEREDYIEYLKSTKEMLEVSKYIIRFLGSVRGTAIEVLKEKK